MTELQQNKILQTHRLFLNRKRLFKHFEAPIFISIPSLVALCFIVKLFIDKTVHFIPPMFLLFLLPVISIAIFLNQYFALDMKQIETPFTKFDNHKFIIKTLETLKWTVRTNNDNFIEAFNPFIDIRTNGLEMISFVIDDKFFLINSICNLDRESRSQAGLSFGKNKQNVKKFTEAFDINAIIAQ